MNYHNDNAEIRYISMFSGIEAATLAFRPLGWKAVTFAEFEKFPSRVLAHHYPDTPNVGDVTKHDWSQYRGMVDIVVGGPPCQAFSVAGLRNSLEDDRGNLSLVYMRALHAIKPRNAIVENVPGWLNTHDNAFGCFLAGLVGADAPLESGLQRGRWPVAGMVDGPLARAAWRVQDAQFHGLAQRRRRVFVVVDFGSGADPAAVLFEPVGVLGNSPPRREAQKDVAGTVAGGARKGGGYSTDDVPLTSITAADDVGCLAANMGQGNQFATSGHYVGYTPEIARCVATREGSSQDYETTTMVATYPINTMIGLRHNALGERTGLGIGSDGDPQFTLSKCHSHAVCVTGDVTHTLRAEGFDASEDGTGRGSPIVAMRESGQGYWVEDSIAGTLRAEGENRPSRPSTVIQQAVALHENQRAEVTLNDTAGALGRGGGKPGQGYPATFTGSAVRRLTPKECERLQGFPDDYTLLPGYDADGPRYKALGNSMAVPVMQWIGERIALHMPAANDNQKDVSRAA